MSRILIAYYSRRGQNYVAGDIVDLPEGNNEVLTRKLLQQVQADTLHIDTLQPYPEDYIATTEVSRQELRQRARPELQPYTLRPEDYDTILLIYPNWWGTMPMPVFTFLEAHDFTDKRIVPCCSHEGSGLGHSVADIRKLCPTAHVTAGVAIAGSTVARADSALTELLRQADV